MILFDYGIALRILIEIALKGARLLMTVFESTMMCGALKSV